jgi:membrane-associated protein
MEILAQVAGLVVQLAEFILHIDRHLIAITSEYGGWTYAILFLIVFSETGLVVTPFLPGDSLLFAAGALSAGAGGLNPVVLMILLIAAANP